MINLIFCITLRNRLSELFHQKLTQKSAGFVVNLKLCTIISILEAEPRDSGWPTPPAKEKY
ncbi:MAG: hypothetical protein EAZ69_14295 [Oscillatoriales cyanobacterium]|nr:MAG: hypothetical protein EAZ69_14295 [Oscillatoriales cyanobacterium]